MFTTLLMLSLFQLFTYTNIYKFLAFDNYFCLLKCYLLVIELLPKYYLFITYTKLLPIIYYLPTNKLHIQINCHILTITDKLMGGAL